MLSPPFLNKKHLIHKESSRHVNKHDKYQTTRLFKILTRDQTMV